MIDQLSSAERQRIVNKATKVCAQSGLVGFGAGCVFGGAVMQVCLSGKMGWVSILGALAGGIGLAFGVVWLAMVRDE